MEKNKIPSFTLAELLVVMVITAIVAGLAFAVLSLVQNQVRKIDTNLGEANRLSLFEQRLWLDFNSHNNIRFRDNAIIFVSDIDTVNYRFEGGYAVREKDTLQNNVLIKGCYRNGDRIESGIMDALKLVVSLQGPPVSLFVSMDEDASNYMNNDGF